jgi:hypothetical protein
VLHVGFGRLVCLLVREGADPVLAYGGGRAGTLIRPSLLLIRWQTFWTTRRGRGRRDRCIPIDRFGMAGGTPLMARAPWNRPGESAQTRWLRFVIFWGAVVLVVFVVATLVYFVVRSASIAGL